MYFALAIWSEICIYNMRIFFKMIMCAYMFVGISSGKGMHTYV